MERVAVFGNAGGGKSTLAKQLAAITGIPLYSLDKMKYQAGGEEIPQAEYLEIHSALLEKKQWIIDGFGCVQSAWQRFTVADTLIYIDLPLPVHFWWVTKRLFKGLFINPEGWPENSPILRGSLNSYRVLGLCHRHLTPRYRRMVEEFSDSKRIHHLRSVGDISHFLEELSTKGENCL